MKRKLIRLAIILAVFLLGFSSGYLHNDKKRIEAHSKLEFQGNPIDQTGGVYSGKSYYVWQGDEILHGDSFEFDFSLGYPTLKIRHYIDGELTGRKTRLIHEDYIHAERKK